MNKKKIIWMILVILCSILLMIYAVFRIKALDIGMNHWQEYSNIPIESLPNKESFIEWGGASIIADSILVSLAIATSLLLPIIWFSKNNLKIKVVSSQKESRPVNQD